MKRTVKLIAQGEQVCLKDSKYVLFEILENQTWKGRTSSRHWQFGWLGRQVLVRASLVLFARISNKTYLESLRHTCSPCTVSFAVPFNFIRFLSSALWVLSSSQDWKAKNGYYYGPFNQRSDEELGKRTFLIHQFLLVNNDRQRYFPHFPPNFNSITNKYGYQCSILWEKIRVYFWFGQVILFWQFFDRQKKGQNEITCLSQKYTLIFFQNMRHQYFYLLGISSNIGGNRGHLLFFCLKAFNLWQSFLGKSIDVAKKFLFLILLSV